MDIYKEIEEEFKSHFGIGGKEDLNGVARLKED